MTGGSWAQEGRGGRRAAADHSIPKGGGGGGGGGGEGGGGGGVGGGVVVGARSARSHTSSQLLFRVILVSPGRVIIRISACLHSQPVESQKTSCRDVKWD